MRIRLLCLLILVTATSTFADEQVRQAQEELRKRNLYFGDVDGQVTQDFNIALKRYQRRKGFEATGTISEETAASLNIQGLVAAKSGQAPLPDMPVLKSDFARRIPEEQRLALENQADEYPDPLPTPPPPAEPPPPSQDINPQRITQLVEAYLSDSETADIAAQTTKYFAYPVDYFDDGPQAAAFVQQDVGHYVKKWPERKYKLTQPVNFTASGNEGETNIEFEIAFNLQDKRGRRAAGRTKNFWTIRPEGNDLKIISIREQRLRE